MNGRQDVASASRKVEGNIEHAIAYVYTIIPTESALDEVNGCGVESPWVAETIAAILFLILHL